MSYMIREVKRELRQHGFKIDTKKEMESFTNQLIVASCICEVLNYGNHRYSDSFLLETLEYYYIDKFEFHRYYDEEEYEEYVYIVYKGYSNGDYNKDVNNLRSLLKKEQNNKYVKNYIHKTIRKINKAV